MRIDDVVHYVPIVGTSISHDGRYVVTATPMYSEERPLRPVRSRVMDLDAPSPNWVLLNPGDGVESLYNPSISPDSKRIQAFRYSNAYLDIALCSLEAPEDPPAELVGVPDEPAALKWRGLPGEPTCLGTDLDGTRRIWVWEDETQPPTALTPATRSVFDYAFSAQTRQLAWIEQKRNDSPSALLHISDDRGEQGFSIPLPAPRWAPSIFTERRPPRFYGHADGRRIARSEVWWVNLEDPENPSIRTVTESVEGWITSVDWNRFSNALVIAVDQGTSGRILHLPLDERPGTWIEEADRYLSGPILDKTRGQLLYLRQGSDLPQQLCLKSGKSKKPRVLTRFNRRMEQRTRYASETVSWKGSDGLPLEGLWMKPDGEGPFPTLVWLHGGPAEHINCTFSPYFQTFLSAGIAIFAPNYRGSTGQGVISRANIRGLCRRDVEDVLSGLIPKQPGRFSRIRFLSWVGRMGEACADGIPDPSICTGGGCRPVVDWVAIFGAQRYQRSPESISKRNSGKTVPPFDSLSSDVRVRNENTDALSARCPRSLFPPSQSALMERLSEGGVETEFRSC